MNLTKGWGGGGECAGRAQGTLSDAPHLWSVCPWLLGNVGKATWAPVTAGGHWWEAMSHLAQAAPQIWTLSPAHLGLSSELSYIPSHPLTRACSTHCHTEIRVWCTQAPQERVTKQTWLGWLAGLWEGPVRHSFPWALG